MRWCKDDSLLACSIADGAALVADGQGNICQALAQFAAATADEGIASRVHHQNNAGFEIKQHSRRAGNRVGEFDLAVLACKRALENRREHHAADLFEHFLARRIGGFVAVEVVWVVVGVEVDIELTCCFLQLFMRLALESQQFDQFQPAQGT